MPPSPGSPSAPLPGPLAAALADFLDAMRVEIGLAQRTLVAYEGDLRRFLSWAARRGARNPADLATEDVVDWLGVRRGQVSERTVARNLVAIRMWLRFLVAEGQLARDPAALLPAPVLTRHLPHVLSAEQVDQLLAAPEGDGWLALRDRALLEVLYATGARISEAVGLTLDALGPELDTLRLHGKGDKMRLVPAGLRCRAALRQWLQDGRPRLTGGRRLTHVFLTQRGTPLSRTDGWRRVKRAARVAGLSPALSPHHLRHSFASHLIEGGADLRAVQEMLGHASIRTTEVYTHLDGEHVRGVHRLYHPRG